LREAVEDPSLIAMLDMIDSCGTTLLDTFNNLLDHAKINNISQTNKSTNPFESRPKSKLSTTVQDLSQLVQLVVDGVHLGHTKTSVLNTSHNESIFTTVSAFDQGGEKTPDEAVLVTLNIEKRSSWLTKLDSGSWKRIVMNLVGMSIPPLCNCTFYLFWTTGNALKYTRSGHVEVGLKLVQLPGRKGHASKPHVCFSVTDTGIGMSEEYVKYQLFTPFVQENSLSPGTGLGLSIVQTLVKNLRGRMEVKSEIGRGTTVKVYVPLNQDTGGPITLQLAPITEDSPSDANRVLRGRSLCYISPQTYKIMIDPDFEITSDVQDRSIALEKALTQIGSDVFGMNLLSTDTDALPNSDLYFLDGHLLGSSIHGNHTSLMASRLRALCPLVVMCGAKLGSPRLLSSKTLEGNFLITQHPLGPKKLSIVLLEALRLGKHCSPMSDDARLLTSSSGINSDPNHLKRSSATSLALQTQKLGLRENAQAGPIDTPEEVSPTAAATSDQQFPPVPGVAAQSPHPQTPHTSYLPTMLAPQSPALLSPFTHNLSPTDQFSGSSEPPHSSSSRRQHLLLVDDNPINLKILTTIVQKSNCTYLPASNGLEAVQIYKSSNKRFDVIFMDISMPVMDGFTATREIRSYEREMKLRSCKIVALTGLGSAASRQEAFASGTNLFLTKPVRLQEVRKLLEGNENERGLNSNNIMPVQNMDRDTRDPKDNQAEDRPTYEKQGPSVRVQSLLVDEAYRQPLEEPYRSPSNPEPIVRALPTSTTAST
jgi:CheY-like chemotaxis protein